MTAHPLQTRIEGFGLAAAACHVLLRRFGWLTSGQPATESGVPFLAINQVTQSVITDIFGCLPSGHTCSRRLIAGHNLSRVIEVNEPYLVISSRAIQALAPDIASVDDGDSATWQIRTDPAPAHSPAISSGSRASWLFEAEPLTNEASHTCIFEVTRNGWLFWAPNSARSGLLQCVLPSPDADTDACASMFGETRILRQWIEPGALLRSALPSAGWASTQLVDENSICCGAAALRYDPVSGDGTGASLRSAILACAVLRRTAEAQEDGLAFNHFRARIGRAFRAHLSACERLYSEADLSPAWNPELAAIREAVETAGRLFPGNSALRFELKDYALI